MTELWVRLIKRQKIWRSETAPMEGDVQDALHELCVKLDIPRPIWLSKHDRDWEAFGLTSFSQDHFVEAIPFDKMEIERIDTEAPKKKSQDPRNG